MLYNNSIWMKIIILINFKIRIIIGSNLASWLSNFDFYLFIKEAEVIFKKKENEDMKPQTRAEKR